MSTASHLLVARRYLSRGFLDSAMELLVRHAASVGQSDWLALAEALMDRQRIADVVRVCELGAIPLPRERFLALGDARLRRRDLDGAKLLYELADADTARWDRFVDVLAGIPGRERLAIEIAERHLVGADARLAAAI
jgi:hypothetical protein